MAFAYISQHYFKKDRYILHLQETKQYIVGFIGPVITTYDSRYCIRICLFNKQMHLIRDLPFKYSCIEKVLVETNKDTLAVVCPENHCVVIIDLETNQQNEIVLSEWPDDEYENELYPSSLYWWQNDVLIIYTTYHRIYRIDVAESSASIINMETLKNEYYNFYTLLEEVHKYKNVSNAYPDSYQFVYHNNESIGFLDLKNKQHHSALYIGNDVHNIFFYKEIFIVVNCYSIELVSKKGIKRVYTLPQESHSELRRSLFISSTGELFVVNEYWHESTRYDTILHFLCDGDMAELTQKEKEQYLVSNHLSEHPYDTVAWLRLILMEKYDDDRLSGRWFDMLHLYDSKHIYAFLIHAYPKVSGILYNQLRLLYHDDAEIMSSIELAKSWYWKKRGNMRKYEQALLKSIEYCSNHTHNLASLGELYLEQGRIAEGKCLIERAMKNVRVIYTEDNRKNYDRYDIQEFMNEHYKGTHQTQKKYEEYKALLQEIV